MLKYIGVAFLIILTSFYLFPFEFIALPGVNTKMVMAGIALLIIAVQLSKKSIPEVNRDFLIVLLYVVPISFVAFVSYVYNGTVDYSFIRYPVPIFVWWAGAYCLYTCIKLVHRKASVELICRYMIAVCLIQCILALVIDQNPSVKHFVRSFVGGEEGFMVGLEGRLYGIGCALDVAGGRFAAILVIIAFLSVRDNLQSKWIAFYIISIIVLVLIGNMIGRTTTVGVLVAVVYWAYALIKNNQGGVFLRCLFITLLCVLPIIIYLYKTDEVMKDYTRFGFEGFFSLFEKGEWDVNSNNVLKDMVVFPDNLKTWIIGDAFAVNPSEYDPYYIGPVYKGFYMNTDIGYLRFIFYFGLIGCMTMVLFMMRIAKLCYDKFADYKIMFLMLLMVNLFIWLKVTSDIFLVFAPFLCLPKYDNGEEKELINGCMENVS